MIKKDRNYNVELLRIIAMLLIIFGHSVGHNHVVENLKFGSVNYFLISFLQIVSLVATNVYVMISGYLLVDKKFKISRVLTLWIQIAFFSIGLYLVCLFVGNNEFSLKSLIGVVLPISGNQYWFARVYFGLYLLSPFLNILLNAMTKKQYQAFLLISFILFSLWRSFIPFAVTLNSEGGNSIIWFVIVYSFAGYIKLHGTPKLLANKHIVALFVFILFVFSFASREIIGIVSYKIGFDGAGTSLFTEFTSFPMLLAALFILIYTLQYNNVAKPSLQKLISFFSASTFSVYLIHENQYAKKILWGGVDLIAQCDKVYILPLLIGVTLMIFILCTLIDKISFYQLSKIINKIKLTKIQNRVNKYLYD